MTTPTADATPATRGTPLISRHLLVDLAIACVLLAGSGLWATMFWRAWMANGGQPQFYQSYFEPSVMVACGKGFVVSEAPRPTVLDEFLSQRRDAIACSDLPADLKVGRKGLYQGAWLYLQTTVGLAWRVLGVSWSGMGPLFGLFFGSVIALAYGVFRIGMGRVAAVACALGLTTSCIHLTNLPHLRDYAKAPFTLALVLILGLLVVLPVRRWSLLALAVAYGAVLGVGYGFRTDFLVDLPVFVLVLFAFVDGGVFRNLLLKGAATVVFLATFAIVSWPISSVVYTQGGCQWHVSLLGLQSPFDEYLHVAPAPYDFGYAYSDGYIYQTIDGYAHRMAPASPPLAFCSPEYDRQTSQYLLGIVATFPGDLATRAWGAVLQVAELPFESWASPLKGWMAPLYEAREGLLRSRIGWGVSLMAAAILLAGAGSVRLGVFLLFFAAYFGGYPAIQFQQRHHFHLEFMTWWAFGFLAHQAIARAWSLRRGLPPPGPVIAGIGRAAGVGLASAVLIGGSMGMVRWYQGRAASDLLSSYLAASWIPVDSPQGTLPDIEPRNWPQFLAVDFDQSRCLPDPKVTFRYDPNTPDGDLSRSVTIGHRSRATGLTRILQPVFEHYRRLEFSDETPGCVVGAYRLADLHQFPLLLGATLPPNWRTLPLHQRLAEWELDQSLPPFMPLPALSTWTTASGRAGSAGLFGGYRFVGDRSTSGYQLTSPRIDAPVGARVVVRTDLSAGRGQVCLGALSADTSKWLEPASAVRREIRFTIDASGGFVVAIANCNPVEIPAPSRFSVSYVTYTIE